MNALGRRTAAALAAALCFVLAGCGDDDDDSASQPTSTPAATVESSPDATPDASADPSSSASPSASASASASADAAEGQTIKINIVDGKPDTKIGTITVKKGDKLTLVITSDADHEVHIHAGDISVDVTKGDTVTKTITVNSSPGSYEVEIEDNGTLLFTLVVK